MKIFWLKQGPLLPLDTGGKIRTWNILKELSSCNDLTVLSFFPTFVHSSNEDARDQFRELISMPVELPEKYGLGYRVDYVRKLVSRVPYVVRQYGIRQVRERVCKLLEQENFDLVVCDFLFPCLNLPPKTSCPQVLFAHNAETTIWKRHFAIARNPLRKLINGIEYMKMRRFEAKRVESFDHIIAVSDLDRGFLAQFVPRSNISVLATGVDLEYFRPSATQPKPGKLVFTGSMDWLANEDAIVFFAQQILAPILQAVPEAVLTVVGRDPTERLKQLAQAHPQIQLTGTVPDVRPYVEEASVYVLPLRVGGGTRLKIFEAMAMGKAIVSTDVGAEGLPVVSGEHLLSENNPQNFANAVIRLLDDTSRRRSLGESARRLVESRFGWPEVGRTFQTILEGVVEMHRMPSASPIHQEQIADALGH
jgi:glycosyltransferase involved in cell wall biosynthesis